MEFSKVTYTNADVVKFLGFVLVISSMWYDLKTDFEIHKEEHKLLEYRITNLETKKIACLTPRVAIMPRETKLEDDK